MIRLRRHSSVYCFVECEAAIKHDLSEQFAFFMPNYQFTPKYKARVWDGKIRLFNKFDSLLPLGLVYRLFKYCKQSSIELDVYDIADQIRDLEYSEDNVNQYLDGMNITLNNGKKISHYEEQRSAIHLAIKNKRSLLLSPTSSGKSLICFSLIEWYMRQGVQGQYIIIVPSVTLVNQLKENFQEYWHEGCLMDPENDIHQIYDTAPKTTDKKIVISTWQGLQRLPKQWFKNFSVSICDEAHNAKGKELTKIHNNMVNAEYRTAMTGTLDGSIVSEMQVESLTGRTHVITTNKEMMDQGKTTPIKIKVIQFNYPHEESFAVKKFSYQEEISYIIRHEGRNNAVCKIADRVKGNALVMFTNISHGEFMYEEFIKKYPNKKAFLLHGSNSKLEDRKEVIKVLEENDDVVLFASYGIFSTGVSVNNIHHVILGAPTKARIRLLQTIGRGLRLHDDKEFVTLWDIADDLTYVKRTGSIHENYTYKHSVSRLQIYVEQEFEYKIMRLNL